MIIDAKAVAFFRRVYRMLAPRPTIATRHVRAAAERLRRERGLPADGAPAVGADPGAGTDDIERCTRSDRGRERAS